MLFYLLWGTSGYPLNALCGAGVVQPLPRIKTNFNSSSCKLALARTVKITFKAFQSRLYIDKGYRHSIPFGNAHTGMGQVGARGYLTLTQPMTCHWVSCVTVAKSLQSRTCSRKLTPGPCRNIYTLTLLLRNEHVSKMLHAVKGTVGGVFL